jgi:hypothetical protein
MGAATIAESSDGSSLLSLHVTRAPQDEGGGSTRC